MAGGGDGEARLGQLAGGIAARAGALFVQRFRCVLRPATPLVMAADVAGLQVGCVDGQRLATFTPRTESCRAPARPNQRASRSSIRLTRAWR